MAARRNISTSDEQLDFFLTHRLTNDSADTIRTNGRESLARTLPKDGAGTGGEGTPSQDAAGSGGENEGRNGHAARGIDEAGKNGATSTNPGVGNGAGEIHPPAARR